MTIQLIKNEIIIPLDESLFWFIDFDFWNFKKKLVGMFQIGNIEVLRYYEK